MKRSATNPCLFFCRRPGLDGLALFFDLIENNKITHRYGRRVVLLLQLLPALQLLLGHAATLAGSSRSTGGRGEARGAADTSSAVAVAVASAAAATAAPSSRPAPALPVASASTAAADSGCAINHGRKRG